MIFLVKLDFLKMSKIGAVIYILVFSVLNFESMAQRLTFSEDVQFLEQYTKTITLKSSDGSQQILVAPEYQGRIMTSTTSGDSGKSHGWINYAFIEQEKQDPNINPYGGMDRLWLGPLGSQYTLYYQGKEFDDKYWHVPHDFDRKPFEVIRQGDDFVEMKCEMKFSNFVKTPFHIDINRKVVLFSKAQIETNLNLQMPKDVQVVGYETLNTLTNLGAAWNFDKGTLALWNLAQLLGNENTAVIIPLKNNSNSINSYLVEIPKERMTYLNKVLLFKGDGKFRSKIGIPPEMTIPLFGSLDLENNILTIIQFQFENDHRYFNSDLGFQDNPYEGDVISVYNNDPEMVVGKRIHSFFELESASAMKALKKSEFMEHYHRTYVIEGNQELLFKLCNELFQSDKKQILKFLQ